MATEKRRLGRGLVELIRGGVTQPEDTTVAESEPVNAPETTVSISESNSMIGGGAMSEVAVESVDVNPYQPRTNMDQESISDLAESIRSEGLLQPIVVRKVGNKYQIIAGERRYRACLKLKLKTIPARIIEASDTSSAVMSMIENLQREGLNPIEEAKGYASLVCDFDLTQEAVAERVGKGRATVANALRLLQLDQEIQGYLGRSLLSVGHAKVLLQIEDANQRVLVSRKILEENMSVRELEKVVSRYRDGRNSRTSNPRPKEELTALKDLEKRMATQLNTPIHIRHSSRKGRIVIEYFGNEDLQRILEVIGINGF
ncbi:MAG: Stage 0 sporulation protein J [Candidatus Moanabacter tarae]|uniref:Stage 0 sporulation protein J n=1 Tax=Candidatus Moanibacter tarae TaxID=2200854 RepID=A0A2Z4ALC2_9BACT|nr:MAG: Stage 0 sporulation protein J [Candidatus Moanabacter tarae]|tara:strand:+ start:1302 stop:2249 length:948 start_codon:yes stop_codon:yes gene_type:complete